MKRVLLVVDLQKEFADTSNNSKEYNKLIRYIKQNASNGYYDKVISTVFCNKGNENFRENLGWCGCTSVSDSSIEYRDFIKGISHTLIFKQGYSDRSGSVIDIVRDYNNVHQDVEIHIVGCDLDACVMAICFQLWDAGITNFKVLTEYCYTSAKDFTKEDIIKIMKRNFGKCVIQNNRLAN